MGHPDGGHTHGSGGSGFGEILVILLAVALLGPVVAAAVAELVHVLLIMAGVIVGASAAGLVSLLAWQLRRTRVDAAPHHAPLPAKVVRAAQPLPKAQRPRELPAGLHSQTPGELHLHFHGLHRGGRRRRPPRRGRCPPGQRPARHTGMAHTGMRRPPQWWLGYACWRWCSRRLRLPDSGWCWCTPPTRQGDRSRRAPRPVPHRSAARRGQTRLRAPAPR